MSAKLKKLLFLIFICICSYIIVTCLIQNSFKQNKIIEPHKKANDDSVIIPPLHPKLHEDYNIFEKNKIHEQPTLSSMCQGDLRCTFNVLSYRNSLKNIMDRSHNNYT